MSNNIIYREPEQKDGKNIYKLVNKVGTLDVNSEYLYLLQSTHFKDTCCVATDNEAVIGFVSGYIIPSKNDTLFIWQVAVDSDYRGQNIAKKIILEIINRENLKNVEYIYSTVSPSNNASQRVFKKVADELKTQMTNEDMFKIEDFVDAHEDEVLYKIGPIKK